MDRRAALKRAAPALLAALGGCSGIPALTEDETPTRVTRTPTATAAPTATASPTPTATGTPTETETSARTETPIDAGAEPVPEATFTVAKEGDADYRSVRRAYRVARDGDVIALGAGEYAFTPEASGATAVTIRGRGVETTLTVRKNGERAAASAALPREFTEHREGVPDIPLATARGIDFANLELRTPAWEPDAGVQSSVGTVLELVDGTLASTRVGSRFVGRGAAANDVTFDRFAHVEATRAPFVACRFGEGVSLRRGSVRDSRAPSLKLFGSLGGGDRVRRCEIGPPTADSTAVVFAPTFGGGNGAIERCTIRGAIARPERKTVPASIGRFLGNEFRAAGGFGTFVHGAGARRYVANAFVGADVVIDDPGVRMYDEARGVGNYYAAWEGSDADGDGIMDLPRPIPGTGEVTDRYPLAAPTPGAYL